MSEVIRAYYEKTKLEQRHIDSKLRLFEGHTDIKEEFEYWICNKNFVENGVEVEGYTAEKLAQTSKFLDGESAFILLIELRTNPHKANAMIKEGFKYK